MRLEIGGEERLIEPVEEEVKKMKTEEELATSIVPVMDAERIIGSNGQVMSCL